MLIVLFNQFLNSSYKLVNLNWFLTDETEHDW